MNARLDAHVIVFGNEKGGSGKSTAAMHTAVALMRLGFRVSTLDLDVGQWTLSRYLENRVDTQAREGASLPMPRHEAGAASKHDSRDAADLEEQADLETRLARLGADTDYLIIDCPGSRTHLGRLAHTHADTLITPLNDSFIDLDLLGQVDGDSFEVNRPSVYAELVWSQRQRRAAAGQPPIDWVVMRNRLASLDARNKQAMERALTSLAKRIGFRLGPGFAERVIFREMFPKGLTVLDVFQTEASGKPRLSHVAARQEVRALLNALKLPKPLPDGN